MADQAGKAPVGSQLHRLEFGKVLEEVAGLASSTAGAEVVLALSPAWEAAGSAMLRRETECAASLLSEGLQPPCSNLDLLGSVLDAVSAGETILEPSELRVIGESLSSFGRFSSALSGIDTALDLDPLAGFIGSLPGGMEGLSARLLEITTAEGELSPSASKELTRLSRKVDSLQRRLSARMEKIAGHLSARGLLRDSPPTIRDGRYVLPVISARRREFGGIVHDRSDSGETVFVEPAELVEDGNSLREAVLDLDFERRRILREASLEVRGHRLEIGEGLVAMTSLDSVFARARYHLGRCTVFPEDGQFSLLDLRHPLIPPEEMVKNDVSLASDWRVLIISGPNAGGKSVLLKAVGLAVACSQCGLGAMAGAGSTLPFFRRLFVSIGDQQSIAAHMSTYSARLGEQLEMLDDPGQGDLALIDEPAAGTDPLTGAALAAAFLEHLADSGCRLIVTTHMGQLKTLARGRPGFLNGCMNFHGTTLKPDYTFTAGLPGSSFTLEIASGMNFPRSILDRASELAGDSFVMDRLLAELTTSRELLAKELADAEETRLEEQLRFEILRNRLDGESAMLEETISRVSAEAEELETRINSRADAMLAKLAREENPAARRELRTTLRGIAAEAVPKVPRGENGLPGSVSIVEPGCWVTVRGWEGTGRVDRVSGSDAVVEMGNLRLRRPLSDLVQTAPPEGGTPSSSDWSFPVGARSEINLLGMTSEEALAELDASLEDCITTGLGRLRVIHGKGRGILMKAVVDFVKHDRRVETFRPGEPGEGGMGVTMVTLRLTAGGRG